MVQRRFTGTVTDEQGRTATMDAVFDYNEAPVIDGIDVVPRPDGKVDITMRAHDPDGGPIASYAGSVDAGTLAQDPANPAHFVWSP